ncbi:hypothetical protein CN918_29740 [Priestia megaterium]|nr:hypothetical protein CN918_29740 [Priestia megaterium]
MIDKQVFLKEIVAELESLKEQTKDTHEAYLKVKQIEREQEDQVAHEKVFERLSQKIDEIEMLDTEYTQIAVGILNNDIRKVSEKVVQGEIDYIETPKHKYDKRRVNHYEPLPMEMKTNLFYRARVMLDQAKAWDIKFYTNYIESDLQLTLDKNAEELFIQHIKNVAIAYVKGYIFQNQPYAYLPEALPSVLWMLEEADNVDLSIFTVFQYPKVLTTHETEESFKQVLKNWYKEKGQHITSFEKQLNKEIAGAEYKSARRFFSRYGYLFDEPYYEEKEKILLGMLYKDYQKCIAIENPVKREQALFGIKGELMKFKGIVPPSPASN